MSTCCAGCSSASTPRRCPIGFSQGQAAFFFPPLALVFVLLVAVRPPAGLGFPVRLWLALVALVFALTGPNVFMGVHFNRYLMWAFPGLLAFTAAGLGVATRLVAREDPALERGLFRAGAGLFLLLGLLSTARFAAVYAEMGGETWRREIPLSAWIRANLPPGVAIANVATSVEYLTGHRNLNLHGVTSPDFVGNRTAEREAGIFESLERVAPARAARVPAAHPLRTRGVGAPARPRRRSPALRDGEPRRRPPPLPRTLGPPRPRPRAGVRARRGARSTRSRRWTGSTSATRATRRPTATATSPGGARSLLAGSVGIGPVPLATGETTLADAGRLIVGGESFRVRTRGGRDLVVVLRSRTPVVASARRAQGGLSVPVEVPEMGILLRAGGREVARLALPNRPGWNEHDFRVPARRPSRRGRPTSSSSGRYAAFHYWFYQ